MLNVLQISLVYGFLYSLVAFSVGAISFRLLRWPDLSCDAAFACGGIVTAVVITTYSSPVLGILFSFIAGAALGTFTSLINTRLGINRLLAGILVMTIGYSVNLRIGGRPNISLLNEHTILTPFENLFHPGYTSSLIIFGIIAVIVMIFLGIFFHTGLGVALRATGDNPTMAAANCVPVQNFLPIGLALSNGLVATSGSLVAQFQGYGDITMGVGTIIVGLASLLIGEGLLRPRRPVPLFISALIGAILYQLIINIALRLGLPPTDLKMATGILVIGALAIRYRNKRGQSIAWTEEGF